MTSAPVTSTTVEAALVHIRRETNRFVEVAAGLPLPVHVPTYPAFTVESLSAHIGRALRIFPAIIESGSYEGDELDPAPSGSAVIDWLATGLDPLLESLRTVSPDKLVSLPHGGAERPAGSLALLLAVEIGVHRWDLESVLGEHASIPADLAISEITSVFENFLPRLASTGVAPIGGTVQLRANDAAVRWAISVDDGKLQVDQASTSAPDADVVVAGSIEDLALIVWKRWLPPRAGVDISGSIDVLKRFLATDYIPDPRTTPAH